MKSYNQKKKKNESQSYKYELKQYLIGILFFVVLYGLFLYVFSINININKIFVATLKPCN